MLAVDSPFRQFFDLTGAPLQNGYLYFGTSGQNPETNPVTVYWDAAGTQPAAQPVRTVNGYPLRSGSQAVIYASGDVSVTVRDAKSRIVINAPSMASFSNSQTLQAGIDAFGSASDATKGDALVAVKRVAITNALATTQHQVNEYREINAVVDYQVPTDGIANATTAIQRMVDDLAAAGVAADIVFPPGTYLLQAPASETGEPRSYAAAVIWRGLKNCRIRGMAGTKFTQNSGGPGAPEFAMFRFERCTNVELCHFDADGSGINIYGTGAARSSFAFICNHNLDTKVDLASPNRGIHIHHLKLDNFGGGICSATRTEAGFAYPLITQGVSVHDIIATNIAGQNHFVAMTYTESVHICNNRVTNPLTGLAQIGNLFCDMSAGTVNALVENNYAIGFTGGAKAETHTGAGVASNEDRVSQNVCFFNNTFEQCGDPFTMIFPGPGGGGFYGIKLNGINHSAIKNTITARTTNATTGGLYQGIQSTSSVVTPVETVHTIHGNDIKGTVLGINHDSPSDLLHRFVADIAGNKIRDTITPATPVSSNDGTGIVISRNSIVEKNSIYRTKRSAVLVQTPDQTIIRNNFAYNCADTNNATIAATVVFAQAGSGAQGFFAFENNVISDTRGASAAAYGYFFEAGTTYANKYVFSPGATDAVQTGISYDTYFSFFGVSYPTAGVTTLPRVIYATQSPQTGGAAFLASWRKGDRAINSNPAVGSAKAWVCTVAGSPGTWVSEGVL